MFETLCPSSHLSVTTVWHWPKNRHRHQWSRIQSPERNPYIAYQLIFDRGAKTIQWGKNSFFKRVLRQLDGHMQKNEFNPYLIPCTKINSDLKS